MTLYRKAIVLRTKPSDVVKHGAPCFDGLFKLGQTSDAQILSYYSQKMDEGGYQRGDYSISLNTVTINNSTGRTQVVA